MKKAIRIHISGYIFNIDEDAYLELKKWLDKIAQQYINEKDGKEIVDDIEMRVAELFMNKVGNEGAITISEVKSIIETMGQPEDFEDDLNTSTTSNNKKLPQNNFSKEDKKRTKNKRLFRDEENKVIAGVCSGLGHYFGIDPVLIRLAFILTVFMGGFGVITYIVLIIVSPKAISTSQKLEMMGEPVNISNIEKAIKEEVEYFKEKFSNKKRHKRSKRHRRY
jgi:phage shock protein PspC (stress-responsive transcriptional regulator)